MANKESNNGFRSVTGQNETAEPAGDGVNAPRKASSMQSRQISQSARPPAPAPAPAPALRKSSSTNLAPQVLSPLAQSPRTSRNASPMRKDKLQTDSLSTKPSAAAIQRALSASSFPHLQQQQPQGSSVSEAVSKLPGRTQKSAIASGESTPQWPISPRLKSPPPSGSSSRRGSAAAQKKPDLPLAPSIQVFSATPQNNSPALPLNRTASTEDRRPEPQLQPPPPPKASTRGPSGKSTLETVQEDSKDTPEAASAAMQASEDLNPLKKINDGVERFARREMSKPDDQKTQTGESGSDSAGNKSDGNSRRRDRLLSADHTTTSQSQQRPKTIPTKNSYALTTTKSRQMDAKGGMTVETETVQSIPQSGLAPAGEAASRLRADNSGSVKLKPSNETIRPKKERKKNDRTKRSVNQGTATSKADLFEQRVANAVDEANTSDSDETFVYESNPPEPQRRQRHHSRTPSVASAHSVADQQRSAIRGFGDAYDDRKIGGKRSMKFSSNPYNEFDSPDSKDGTIRTHTPRHIGRFGRGGYHSASYDTQDSPFTQASRLRQNQLQRSRPNSPRSPQNAQFRPSGFLSGNRKQEQPYDFDTEQNADDERTPLVGSGTVRGPRYQYRRSMRPASGMTRSFEDYDEPRRRRCCSGKTGACLLTTIIATLVIISAVFFVFASNRPLYDVAIHDIKNVLASEQELMFDLRVGAINPNTLGITIGDMDVNVFAKSKHVSKHKPDNDNAPSAKSRRRQLTSGSSSDKKDPKDKNPNPIQDSDGHWHAPGDDENDSDTEKDSQTMLLGRIFRFDQALMFESSPIKQRKHYSTGQLRLMKPGNKTETGGSDRWEQVIQYPFELVVRGVLKYQLPISSRLQSAAVGASVMVHPEEGIDRWGNMRVEPVHHDDHWQWVEWPDLLEDPIVEDPDDADDRTEGDGIEGAA